MRARELRRRLPRPWRCPVRTVVWRLTCVHLKFCFAKVAPGRFSGNLDARPRGRFPCDEGRQGTLLRFLRNCQQKFQRFADWVCETVLTEKISAPAFPSITAANSKFFLQKQFVTEAEYLDYTCSLPVSTV